MTIGRAHDGVAQYACGEFLDERRNSDRLSPICLPDLSRQRILPDHLGYYAGMRPGEMTWAYP
jgi:hypothetical protein